MSAPLAQMHLCGWAWSTKLSLQTADLRDRNAAAIHVHQGSSSTAAEMRTSVTERTEGAAAEALLLSSIASSLSAACS